MGETFPFHKIIGFPWQLCQSIYISHHGAWVSADCCQLSHLPWALTSQSLWAPLGPHERLWISLLITCTICSLWRFMQLPLLLTPCCTSNYQHKWFVRLAWWWINLSRHTATKVTIYPAAVCSAKALCSWMSWFWSGCQAHPGCLLFRWPGNWQYTKHPTDVCMMQLFWCHQQVRLLHGTCPGWSARSIR